MNIINKITFLGLLLPFLFALFGVISFTYAILLACMSFTAWFIVINVEARNAAKMLIAYRPALKKNDTCFMRSITMNKANILDINHNNDTARVEVEVKISDLYPIVNND